MLLNKDHLDASNEAADKNKKIIKDIIDPTPGPFIDNKLNANDQIFKNTTDSIFKYNNNVMTLFLKQLKQNEFLKQHPKEIFLNKVFQKRRFFY